MTKKISKVPCEVFNKKNHVHSQMCYFMKLSSWWNSLSSLNFLYKKELLSSKEKKCIEVIRNLAAAGAKVRCYPRHEAETKDWYWEDLPIVVYMMQMDLRILILIHKCWESIIKIHMHALLPCTNCCTWNQLYVHDTHTHTYIYIYICLCVVYVNLLLLTCTHYMQKDSFNIFP